MSNQPSIFENLKNPRNYFSKTREIFRLFLIYNVYKENIFKIEIDVREAPQSLAFKIYFACLGLFVKMAEPIGPNILWDFKLSQGRFIDAQNFKNLS